MGIKTNLPNTHDELLKQFILTTCAYEEEYGHEYEEVQKLRRRVENYCNRYGLSIPEVEDHWEDNYKDNLWDN